MNQSTTTRISVRLPCEFPAEITFSGGGTEIVKKAMITNVSTTGIQILSPSFVATGQKIKAAFKVPGSPKTVFQAEIMRIESLQGRMIGHFPYALGAKFVEHGKKQEKQITHFISGKITCVRARALATLLFLVLGFIQIGRTLLHTVFTASDWAAMDLRGFQSTITGNWLLHPIICGSLVLGFLASAILCILNKKFFLRLGFFWATAQTVLSLIIIYMKRGLLAGNSTDLLLLNTESFIFTVGIIIMALCFNIRGKLQQIEKILTATRPSSGPNRPTFTIL